MASYSLIFTIDGVAVSAKGVDRWFEFELCLLLGDEIGKWFGRESVIDESSGVQILLGWVFKIVVLNVI